jgi:acyl carrier protein
LPESTSSSEFDTDALTKYCINFVAEMLERAPADIDPNVKFSRIGFDSAMSVQLIVALEELLNIELSPDLTDSFQTIASLSAHLAKVLAQLRKDA